MAISRAQLAKELEPGLNALFGMEYARYDDEHAEIYETESSDRAFEEEVMLTGLAPDGGLYIPEELPQYSAETIRSWGKLSYPELAYEIMKPFIGHCEAGNEIEILHVKLEAAIFCNF